MVIRPSQAVDPSSDEQLHWKPLYGRHHIIILTINSPAIYVIATMNYVLLASIPPERIMYHAHLSLDI